MVIPDVELPSPSFLFAGNTAGPPVVAALQGAEEKQTLYGLCIKC